MDFISDVAKRFPPSGTRVMFDLARQYDDVIMLTVGEPNFETPKHIVEAGIKGLQDGLTKYSPNAGMTILREAIAEKHAKELGLDYKMENVVVACGGIGALFLLMRGVLDAGDEVIISDPNYPNYSGLITLLEGKIVRVPVYEEKGFRMNAPDIAPYITDKTKMIILNSPSNPLGAMLTKEDLAGIAELAIKHDLCVISDEIYDRIIYDGNKHYSISTFPGMKERTFIINGFSKSYAMTGWRAGYIVGNAEVLAKLPPMYESINTNIPEFVQMGCLAALKGSQDCVDEMVVHYKRRMGIVVDGLNAIDGISCLRTTGSFYAFPNIKSFGVSSLDFCIGLLKSKKVAIVPGSAFGEKGEGHLRITFADSDENLHEAIKRIGEYTKENF